MLRFLGGSGPEGSAKSQDLGSAFFWVLATDFDFGYCLELLPCNASYIMLIPQLIPHAGHARHADDISIGAFHQEGYSSAVHVVKRAFETVARRLAFLGLIHPSQGVSRWMSHFWTQFVCSRMHSRASAVVAWDMSLIHLSTLLSDNCLLQLFLSFVFTRCWRHGSRSL